DLNIGGENAATCINNAGHVAGGGFLWTPSQPNGTSGSFIRIPLTPVAINASDQLVEGIDLWQNGQIIDLSSFGIHFAQGINDADQVAGVYGVYADHAAVWENGTVTDLGVLGGSAQNPAVSFATGINALGQVAGATTVGDGSYYHAFLWTR